MKYLWYTLFALYLILCTAAAPVGALLLAGLFVWVHIRDKIRERA